jgi:hypothetical protein
MNLGKFELDLGTSGLNLDKCGLDLFSSFRYCGYLTFQAAGKPARKEVLHG